jgi:hypothetical protein
MHLLSNANLLFLNLLSQEEAAVTGTLVYFFSGIAGE